MPNPHTFTGDPKIDELYDRYNIPLDTDDERNEEILEPQIVVSESFI